MNLNKKSWKTLTKKIVYKNSIIRVREDKVIKPNGKVGIYAFVQVPRTVGIVALDKEKNIYLCQQFRYIFQDYTLEIPRGFIADSEIPRQAAERELKEEAGVRTQKLISLGKLRLSAGLIDEECNIYLALDVKELKRRSDEEHEITSVQKIPLSKVLFLIGSNRIVDGLTVSAVLKANQFLERQAR